MLLVGADVNMWGKEELTWGETGGSKISLAVVRLL